MIIILFIGGCGNSYVNEDVHSKEYDMWEYMTPDLNIVSILNMPYMKIVNEQTTFMKLQKYFHQLKFKDKVEMNLLH